MSTAQRRPEPQEPADTIDHRTQHGDVHAADRKLMTRAGLAELLLDVAQLRIGIAQQQRAKQRMIERAIGGEAFGEQPARALAKIIKWAHARGADDRDVAGRVDMKRSENPLLAIIAGPVKLAGIHRRPGAFEQAEHADALVERELWIRLRDLHEHVAAAIDPAVPGLHAFHGRRHRPASEAADER